MLLCVMCGRVDDHDVVCPRRLSPPKNPAEKAERVQRAIGLALSTLAFAEKESKTAPRQGLLRVLNAEMFLGQYPSASLEAFDQKRAHNEASTKIAKKRTELEEQLGADGKQLVADYAFAKIAVEKFFALTCRRMEATMFDASALEKLPIAPIQVPAGRTLKEVCDDLEKRLEEGRLLDSQVAEWGWKNLRSLMVGIEPVDESSPGAMSYLGALVGRGPTTRRFKLNNTFRVLGDQFRERLYMLGANAILLKVVSRLAQAEESWKKHLRDDGSARWRSLKRDGIDVLRYILGNQEGLPEGVEDIIASYAPASKVLVLSGLAPFTDIQPEEWEAYAMAYFFELDAVVGELSSRDIGASGLAAVLIERRKGVEQDRAGLAKSLQHVRDTWRARPPRERPPKSD